MKGEAMCCDYELWSDGAMYCIIYQGGLTVAQDMSLFPNEKFYNMLFRHLQDDITPKPTREIIIIPTNPVLPTWAGITIGALASGAAMAIVEGVFVYEFPVLQ